MIDIKSNLELDSNIWNPLTVCKLIIDIAGAIEYTDCIFAER